VNVFNPISPCTKRASNRPTTLRNGPSAPRCGGERWCVATGARRRRSRRRAISYRDAHLSGPTDQRALVNCYENTTSCSTRCRRTEDVVDDLPSFHAVLVRCGHRMISILQTANIHFWLGNQSIGAGIRSRHIPHGTVCSFAFAQSFVAFQHPMMRLARLSLSAAACKASR
jgi:hypothetical protein